MLLNQLLEVARAQLGESRELRRRARRRQQHTPLVLVPSILGTRLVDSRGRGGWSTTRDLYGLPFSATTKELHPAGLLEGFTVVPRLWSYDVYGGLVRYLVRVGGYVLGETLFVLGYDWRTGLIDAAAKLDALVGEVSGRGAGQVDLLGVSSGGLVARYLLASAPEGVGHAANAPRGQAARRVRRLICVGTPQRGTFSALDVLANGSRPAPLGRRFAGRQIAGQQTVWDLLPHPSERIFIDDRGEILDASLYDPEVWLRLGIVSLPGAELAMRLAGARRFHETLDLATPHADTFVVGSSHLPTVVRAYVSGGRVRFPSCTPAAGDPHAPVLYAPGDGMTTESSLRALPGLPKERMRWVSTKVHRSLPADPEVHRLLLESLLAD